MKKVLMICHGNICRSTMAEFVLKDLLKKYGRESEFEVYSAGTSRDAIGFDTHRGTKKKLSEKGISFTKREARQVVKHDYDSFDFLICMDKANIRNLAHIIGKDIDSKVCLLLDFTGEHTDIADPWYTGNFDITYDEVLRGCEAFLSNN